MALFIENSENRKLSGEKGHVACTYASIKHTCPKSCKLMGNGCYAELGLVRIHLTRLERSLPKNVTRDECAKMEAKAIRNSFKGNKIPQDSIQGGVELRLHVSGDATTKGAAKILAKAVDNWYERGGGKAWTYTHAWKTVPRSAWGGVSILASIDDTKDAKAAMKQGYAPARVVQEHASPKAHEENGINWIPCPQQTKSIPCIQCRLCLNADKLYERKCGIEFAVHGSRSGSVKKRLAIIK